MLNIKFRLCALFAAILLISSFSLTFSVVRAQENSSVDSILTMMQTQDSIDAAADTSTFHFDAYDDEEFIMPPEPTRSRNWFKRNIWKKVDWIFFILFFVGTFIMDVIATVSIFKLRRKRNDSYIIPVVISLAALLASVVILFVLSLLHGLVPRYLYVAICSVLLVVCFLIVTKAKSHKKE